MSRQRMPHGNRVSSSSALNTNDIWKNTIGYDPYGDNSNAKSDEDRIREEHQTSVLLLAKMSNLSGTEARGGCKKCGMLGHLTFQCRNESKPVAKDDSDSESESSDDGDDEDSALVATESDKLKDQMTTTSSSLKRKHISNDSDNTPGKNSRDEANSSHESDKKHHKSEKKNKKHKKSSKEEKKDKKHKSRKSSHKKHKKDHS